MRIVQKPINTLVPPLLCVFLLITLQWISLMIGKSTCLSADGVALMFFKNMFTDDPYDAMGDWNATDDSPCTWNGVLCSSSTEQAGGTSSVVSLDLAGKMLTGNISPALGALASLQTLKLQGNLINGTLPVQLFNATTLQTLLLGGNNISSLLPSEIGNLIKLRVLDISSNRMYGFIPASLTKCRQLQTLLLARNLFSGPIIDGFGANFNSLQQLDLSSNLLSGSIPADFGKLSALRGTLNLSYNHLSGPIPVSLGSLPYTVSLDFSHNNLTGRIPQAGSLAEQGPGPFLFNPGLCGFPLSIVCPITPFLSPLPSLPTEASSPYKPTKRGRAEQRNSTTNTPKPSLRPGVIAAIALGDAAALSVFATLYIYLYWKARSCKEDLLSSCAKEDITKQASKMRCFHTATTQEESEASPLSEKDTEQGELVALDKRFSFDIDELLRASAYVLGKSGQSIVYKVVLGNGTPVVVRQLGEASTQSKKDFEGEVQAIGKLRHPNVVRLLAYCWANDEKLLVYEYISHGNLAAALNGNSPQHPSRMLTWEERLRIARGMARGLAYLHEFNSRKCTHADIRTTKILLDSHMCPYIADFGVARLAAQSGIDSIMGGAGPTSSIHSNALEWSGPQARTSTSWIENMYRAPEASAAVLAAKPTQKWDVYAYGVVAMELICGRPRALQMGMAGVDFVGWMRRSAAKEGGAQVMVDPAIAGAEGLQSMAVLLSLAVACTSASPDHRPKMRTIADALDKLVSA